MWILSQCLIQSQMASVDFTFHMNGQTSVILLQKDTCPTSEPKHTDQDIGYGPEVGSGSGAAAHKTDHHDDQEDFHPPAPPVTLDDGSMEQGRDMVAFDSNFIMTKKTENAEVRQVSSKFPELPQARGEITSFMSS